MFSYKLHTNWGKIKTQLVTFNFWPISHAYSSLASFETSTIRGPSVCEIFCLPRMSKFDGSMVYHKDALWPAFPLTATGTNYTHLNCGVAFWDTKVSPRLEMSISWSVQSTETGAGSDWKICSNALTPSPPQKKPQALNLELWGYFEVERNITPTLSIVRKILIIQIELTFNQTLRIKNCSHKTNTPEARMQQF